jgi:hypothetical protein
MVLLFWLLPWNNRTTMDWFGLLGNIFSLVPDIKDCTSLVVIA